MRAWTNAEVHVYLDRTERWRARVRVTLHDVDEQLQLDVPPLNVPGFERAHGLVPLFLRLAETLECVKGRKVSDGGRGS